MKTIKNKITWTKMSGAENSFWITHFLSPASPSINRDWSQVAQILCKKNNSSKADGLAILLPSKHCDFKWLFYNADGSPAEMCGNAACCVTDYVFKKKIISVEQNFLIFETKAQQIKGELKEGMARIFLKQSTDIQGPFETTYNNEATPYVFINSSVPHAVIEIKNWPSTLNEWENKKKLAGILRKKTTHHKDGMNVSFYCHQDDNHLSARTFERGVEDFTPACGTGALAVAQVYRQYFPHVQLIFVKMPGGQLEISLHSDKTISLMSPVKWLQEMEEK